MKQGERGKRRRDLVLGTKFTGHRVNNPMTVIILMASYQKLIG